MTTKELAALMMQEVRRFVAEQMTPTVAAMKEVQELEAGHLISLGELRRRVETVEQRPLPEHGKDFDPADLEAAVVARVAPLEKELATLREMATGLPALIKGLAESGVETFKRLEAVEQRPTPKDGKSVDPEQVQAMVEEAVKSLPVPKDGESPDPLEIVKAVLALIPTPKDGKDGIGTREELMAVAKELITVQLDAAVEKAVTIAVAQIPRLEWKGVWTEGEYTKGNNVTWAGSLWICVVEKTTAKPETNADWKLAVKRGRDGR